MTDYNNNNDNDASSLTSEESHEPYFDTQTGAILSAREAWTILAETDDRYRVKLEQSRRGDDDDDNANNNDDANANQHQQQQQLKDGSSLQNDNNDESSLLQQLDEIAASPSNEETASVASLGPSQSTIDRALHSSTLSNDNIHYHPSPLKKDKKASSIVIHPNDDDEEETDPDILRAQAMALAAANGQKLTPEQIILIAQPDVQQQKLIEESRIKAKLLQQQNQQHGLVGIGADIKKFIEGEKEKRPVEWGVDLGRFIEEQSLKLHGGSGGNTTTNTNTANQNVEGKKKMEGFGSSPPLSITNDTKDPPEEKVRISAIVWKRRSGLGKHSTIKAWEKRKVELRGSRLLYYETAEEGRASRAIIKEDVAGNNNANSTAAESTAILGSGGGTNDRSPPAPSSTKKISIFEQAAQNAEQRIQTAKDELSRMMAQTVGFEGLITPNNNNTSNVPRGILDIIKENATISASTGHTGAPSPYCLSIKVKSETKWKFAFDTYETLLQWLLALNDVVIRSSVDAANDGQEGNIVWVMQEHSLTVMDGGDSKNDTKNTESMPRTFLRQLTNTDAMPDSSSNGGRRNNTTPLFRDVHFMILLMASNLAIFLSRSSWITTERYWNLVVFFNFGMRQLYNYTLGRSNSSSNDAVSRRDKSVLLSPRDAAAMNKLKSDTIAGSSCIKINNVEEDSNNTESGSKKKKPRLPTWLPVSSSEMEVRSRGYLTTKKKIPSPGELYECIAVDCFQSDCRYSEMALRVVLPKVEFNDGGSGGSSVEKCWKSPDLFVVSIAIPTEAPSLGKSSEDGPGFTIVGYFRMKQTTRDILRRITADDYDPERREVDNSQKDIVNGVKLWERYCKTAPTDSDFQARFKLIPQLNMEELGCPSYISKYNGKPVLIKRNQVTGFFHDYPDQNAMEFDISLHPFPYLFKQGTSYIKDNYFDEAIGTFGFVIEGRNDEELPEVVIGALQLRHPSPQYVMTDKEFFGKAN